MNAKSNVCIGSFNPVVVIHWPTFCRWFAVCLAAMILGGSSGFSVHAFQIPTGPGSGGDQAAANRFRNLNMEIQKNEREISALFSSMPIGFAKEQQAQLDKIDLLKKTNEELRGRLDQAALESFQAAPKDNPNAVRHVFELMSAKIDGKGLGKLFDPVGALEIANMMMKADFEAAPIFYQAFRASFALQDFQRAETYIEKYVAAGEKLDPAIYKLLADSKTKWQRETSLRNKEETDNDLPRVKLVTTEGEIVIEMFENEAPQTVANFISLVESKFYDGLIFHLVRPGEFAQGGSSNGDGTGDPGYQIANETDRTDLRNFFAGTVGMSHEGPDTAGSKFFIAYQANPSYDDEFVAMGRVIEGMDVVYSLKKADKTVVDNPETDIRIPVLGEPTKIISAVVLRKRDHDYQPVRIEKPLELPAGSGLGTIPGSSVPDVAPEK